MQYIRSCIVCTTPFQIYAALCIAQRSLETIDLYIGNRFSNSQMIAENLSSSSYFNRVNYIDQDILLNDRSKKNRYLKRIRLAKLYKNIDRVMETILENRLYDRIYISNNAVVCRLFALYHIKHNKGCEVIYYDDGVGTYCNPEITQFSQIERCFQRLFIDQHITNDSYSYCLFAPELFKKCISVRGEKISKNEPLSRNEINDKSLRDVFGVSTIPELEESVIVLDTLKTVEFNPDGIAIINAFYRELYSRIPNNIIFKKHPKDEEFNDQFPHFDNPSIPFELITYYRDISNKIIITNMSSAAFNPKLLFDQEPYIIFLFKIMRPYMYTNADIEAMVSRLKELYTDSKKIYIPKSFDEAISMIEELVNDEQK